MNKHLQNGHPNLTVFGKVQKVFKKPLHYVWTGRGQIVGCFLKKFKTPITYSHWEKLFVRPNSEMFTKNSKFLSLCLHWEGANWGEFFEKFLKNFLWQQKCCHHFKKYSESMWVDGRIAVTFQTPFTCLELEGTFTHPNFKKISDNKKCLFCFNSLDILPDSGKLSRTKTKNHLFILNYGTHSVR